MLIIVGNLGKMHVYSVIDFNILLCIEPEHSAGHCTIAFSPNSNFFLVGFTTGDLDIYKIPVLIEGDDLHLPVFSTEQANCECLKEFEREHSLGKPTTTSFILGGLSRLTNSLFEVSKMLPFARYRITEVSSFICFFEKKNEFTIITDTQALKVKFNSLEGGVAWNYKIFKYLEKSLY